MAKWYLSDGNGTKLSLGIIWWLIGTLAAVSGTLAWASHSDAMERIQSLEQSSVILQVELSKLQTTLSLQEKAFNDLREAIKGHNLGHK